MPRKRSQAQEQQEPVTAREPGDESEHEASSPQRGWKHDNAAGVERLYYTDTTNGVYEAWLKFRDKPPQKVIDFVKDQGYRPKRNAPRGGRWPEVEWAWAVKTNYETLSQDRLKHERVFDKVVEMTLAEKGIPAPQKTEGVPF